MPASTRFHATETALPRLAALAALSAATFLAAAFPVHAETATPPATQQAQTGDVNTNIQTETLDERIANLHSALEITPAEEPGWSKVAQTMRDNEAEIEKLGAEKAAAAGQNQTAIMDLENYQRFAEAHVAGLKNLIASFRTLYESMPARQQKLADEVFENFGHKAANPAHG